MSTSPQKRARGRGRLSLKSNTTSKRPSTSPTTATKSQSIISLFKKQETNKNSDKGDHDDDIQIIEEPSPTKSPYFSGKITSRKSSEKLRHLRKKSKDLFESVTNEKVIELSTSLKLSKKDILENPNKEHAENKGLTELTVNMFADIKESGDDGSHDVVSSGRHVEDNTEKQHSLSEQNPGLSEITDKADDTTENKETSSVIEPPPRKRLKLERQKTADIRSELSLNDDKHGPPVIDEGIHEGDNGNSSRIDEKSVSSLKNKRPGKRGKGSRQERTEKSSVEDKKPIPTVPKISSSKSPITDEKVSIVAENSGNDSRAQKGETKINEDDTEEGKTEYRIPYYLEYFHIILKTVMDDEYYARLFNEDDFSTLRMFQELSEPGQKLYIRLFQRKLRWLRVSQIDYPKIAVDLSPILNELVVHGLLHDESHMTDLEGILVTLPAGDLRTLAKSLRLSTSEQRPAIIGAILKHAKQRSIGAFFSGKGGGTNEANVMKRGQTLLGKCYRVDKEKRWVFLRVMMLFSLHNITGEEDETSNTQLFQMLMNNTGQMTYPDYQIHRVGEIFRYRDDLLTFCKAVQMESDIREAVEGNRVEDALAIYETVKPLIDSVLRDKALTKHVKCLPEHLRWYTTGAVYTRVLTQGVEALQKKRDYQRAVTQLEALIKQPNYHTDYRGRWYDRLALNVHTHLKQPEKALSIIQRGLADPCVRVGHRYSIWQRAQKICTAPATQKLHHHWATFKDDTMSLVKESPKVTIEGKQISIPGAQTTWCSDETYSDGTGEVTFIKNVEDVALRHYAQNGYPKGLHGEGGTVSIFFTLFLWDVLFSDVPDAFINPYQTMPLDLYTDNFYISRKHKINARIAWIKEASDKDLEEELTRVWTEKEETSCIGVRWDRFEDLQHAQGLLRCLEGRVLAALLKRMVECLRFTRSGFPDLIVWNPETKKFKVVEVKGPGDRLSTKQILWLDFLLVNGVDAEVCYVTAVGAKRLRTSQ